jgi:hypothetical protein
MQRCQLYRFLLFFNDLPIYIGNLASFDDYLIKLSFQVCGCANLYRI